jgi:Flp pilus assembly CpaF family ATPase
LAGRTGKTTLTNAILLYMDEVATADRLVLIEEKAVCPVRSPVVVIGSRRESPAARPV